MHEIPFPVVNDIVDLMSTKNPLHAKEIRKYINSCENDFLEFANSYLDKYISHLTSANINLEFIIDSYLLVVEDTFKEQIRFFKTGKYKHSSFNEVYENVYANSEYMFKYMVGLALTQFFWKNHKNIFLFFKCHIMKVSGTDYLEIGPGHGLYLSEAIKSQNFKNFTAVDVSETSLNMCKSIVAFQNRNNNVDYKLMDIYDYQPKQGYDFISMGEVLEHIETPAEIMKKLYELLAEDGMIFITTCANAPAIDHIYLFNNVDEIRDLFKSCNFKIKDELALPYGDRTLEETIQKKLTLNYCALISKT